MADCRDIHGRRTGGLLLVALAAALLVSHPVCGAPLSPAGAKSLPVVIEAQSGIEWQQNAQVYIARGDAVAKRGKTELRADTLTAYYRRNKGAQRPAAAAPTQSVQNGLGLVAGSDTEIYRIDADGHVVIKGPTQTVVGSRAVYDVDQGIAVVTGKGLRMTTPEEVVTAHKSLEWYDRKGIAVARGDALAVRGDRRIRADVLTAYFVKDDKAAGAPAAGKKPVKPKSAADETIAGGEKITRIDATGHVVVTTPTDIGRGDYAVYNAEKGIVTLLDHVTITRGADTIRGQYAVIDLNRNISRMMTLAPSPGGHKGKVEALFVPRQTTGSGGNPGALPKSPGKPSKSAGKP